MKYLQSKWTAVLVGAATYFATIAVMWQPKTMIPPPPSPVKDRLKAFDFGNISGTEIDLLITNLKAARLELEQREQKLTQWELRLRAERQEILRLTEQVQQKCTDQDRQVDQRQLEFNKFVVRVESNEVTNITRLAATYSDMEPAAAVAIFKEMPDDKLLKILAYIDHEPLSAILANIAKDDPKRAATVTERLRLVVTPATNAVPLTASANPS